MLHLKAEHMDNEIPKKQREKGKNNGQKTPKFDEVIHKSDARRHIIIKWSKAKIKKRIKK